MTKSDLERKVAVIFAADIVGFSKHAEIDEESTLSNLDACNELLERLIKNHNGRVFNTGGDSVFAELPSAVAAVNMAADFQAKIRDRNEQDRTKIKLQYRVGINMGDVVKQGEKNLMGEGVNIAARLESLAQPGGITISKNIYELVINKTNHEFSDLGNQQVKENIFHAYDVVLNPSQRRKLKTRTNIPIAKVLVGGLVAMILIGFLFSEFYKKDTRLEANKIVILPFQSLGDNDKEKLFAVGISHDVGSKLIKSSKMLNVVNLKVIPEDLKEISKKTNASYLIDGSLMQLDGTLRVKVNLLDGRTTSTIWSETYDMVLDGRNLFSLQDDIINKVINELVGAGAVLSKDINKKIVTTGTTDLSIYECINFARGANTKTSNEKAISCLDESVKRDPNYADAWFWLADRKRAQYSSFSMNDEFLYMLKEASGDVDKGLMLDPQSAFGYTAKVQIEFFNKNWEKMFNVAEAAYKLSGKNPNNLAKIGQSIAFGGQCGREDVRVESDEISEVESGRCQFYRGCWELGEEARKLDIGNFSVWDNYLTAICSVASRNGKQVVEALEPLQHKKYFWWEFNLGVAYHYLEKYQIAEDHFGNARNALGTNKIEKIRALYTKFNSHKITFPNLLEILPQYGFE